MNKALVNNPAPQAAHSTADIDTLKRVVDSTADLDTIKRVVDSLNRLVLPRTTYTVAAREGRFYLTIGAYLLEEGPNNKCRIERVVTPTGGTTGILSHNWAEEYKLAAQLEAYYEGLADARRYSV